MSALGPELAAPGWDGRLELEFESRDGRSVVARRLHRGPLGMQRAFYPEPDGTCHAYILHPPGGVVGGDRLSVDARIGADARVLLTTPAATKFYRSAGARAQQRQRFVVGPRAQLEWLPQDTIVFEGAVVETGTRIELEAGAAFLGWEVLCLGRPASGERFTRGSIDQRVELMREGVPLLIERARYAGGGPELEGAWGLRGGSVVATLYCVPANDQPLGPADVEALRALLAAHAGARAACSQLAGALVCRYVGDGVEPAMRAFRAAWSLLRPVCFGKPSKAPRIWST